MSDISNTIFSVDTSDFEEKVVNASFDIPVLVDFWADWCAPCKALGPLLERIVNSYNGAIALAKMDVDANRELASKLGIRSIPTVKIFLGGKIVNEFVGVLPEGEIRSIIDSISASETEELLSYAEKLSAESRFDEAESVYESILKQEPENSEVILGWARLKIIRGDSAGAGSLLDSITEYDEKHKEAVALAGALENYKICEKNGGIEKSRIASAKNPDDLEARYILGCCYAAEKLYREALDTFLAIVKKDRRFGDGKARKSMLSLFALMGRDNPLTDEYRKRLAMEMF